MKYAAELRVLRRYLRDPDGNIWSDDLVRTTWNQAQEELQADLGVLENVRALPVPPRANYSYQYPWEWAFVPSGSVAFPAMRQQSGFFCFTGEWEVQSMFVANSTDDTGDAGIAWTHPWEGWLATPNEAPLWQLPEDWHSMKQAYYDERPIQATTRKWVINSDRSYKTREGEPQVWYQFDDVSRQVSVYPKPATAIWADESGEGMVTSTEDDTESGEVGAVVRVEGYAVASGLGITVDVIDGADQLILVYDVMPPEVVSEDDELVWPEWMLKYLRYRVLQRLYGINTDGRIPSLANFWGKRYEQGKHVLRSWVAAKRRDRIHTFATHKRGAGRRKPLPSLPDAYPRV